MKKLCFIEMEGVLLSHKHYSADEKRAVKFVEELLDFCGKREIEVFLISGFNEKIAHERFDKSFLKNHFDDTHFLHVDKEYISQKAEPDKKIHLDSLKKDAKFNDSYFKQVIIPKILEQKKLFPKDALLLAEDLWIDGYYTTRFSKIDFAIFEENVSERGKPSERISGLSYFSLESDSVKQLLEKFPQVSFFALEKFVFEKMKNVLVDEKKFADNLRSKLLEKNKE